MRKPVATVKNARTVPNLKLTEKNKKKKKGFWTFNKNVRVWNVYDPDWLLRNRKFSLEPLIRK